jgi:hypothetical protein
MGGVLWCGVISLYAPTRQATQVRWQTCDLVQAEARVKRWMKIEILNDVMVA